MSTFSSTRGGSTHFYEVGQSELLYRAELAKGAKKEFSVRWRDLEKIIADNGGILYFVPKKLTPARQKIAIWLEDAQQMSAFLESALDAWAKEDRGAAAKAALDYGADFKFIGKIWLVLALIFPGLLAVLLLSDGLHTKKCNALLESNLKTAPAELIKITKDRRGNFVWKLKFATEAGDVVTGKRTAFIFDQKGQPTSPLLVGYAPNDLTCWDVEIPSHATQELSLNRSNRRFSVLMNLSFGSLFAALAVAAAAVGVERLRRKRPQSSKIRTIGERIASRRSHA